ncbi:MAG TPA: glycosyltransferase family 39 protein [Thermoanaerobaculia bacterium]|nr:glycosyltransferase family 39 protein [Thermoanaerobaculia bacterium]
MRDLAAAGYNLASMTMQPAAAAARGETPWQRRRRRCGLAAAALAALVVALWLLDISRRGEGGHAVPAALCRAALALTLGAGVCWLAAALAARLEQRPGRRLAALALPVLVALALAVRFAGIDSEVSGRYYADEGTYYHHATSIDGGELLSRTFVYPHLTYYADALTLWAAGLFPAGVAAMARRLYGLADPLAVAWLLLRGLVALLSALTVVPVYAIAKRLGGGDGGEARDGGGTGLPGTGHAAAALAAGTLIVSALFNEGSHLNTCDVPSAFFATVCLLYVVRLMARESPRDYALAGVAAGLAAASKYPAGLVALGIAAVWASWRARRRDWNAGLVWAALAAALTVVAAMPSLLVYPGLAFAGPRGIFYGARQYGQGGWLGVMPESNAGFYAGQLVETFGWPALGAGLSGLLLLAVRRRPDARRRLAWLLWLAPYPVAYLALVASMNMVVKRNLYPVLPVLAVYLGVGMAEWLDLAARTPAGLVRRPGGAAWRWAAGALAVACLWPPAELTVRQTIGYVSPSTREEAAAWIVAHLPPGAAIVKESYTPDFTPGRFAVTQERFAGRIPFEDLRRPDNDYLLLSSAAYSRFRDPRALFTDNQRQLAGRYDQIFRTFPLVKEWLPDDLQVGPVLRLFRIDPDLAACPPAAELPAADAFVPDEGMRAAPLRPLRYRTQGEWSLFRGCLPAGRYRIGLAGQVLQPALVRVADAAGRQLELLAARAVPAAGPAPAGGAGAAAELTLERPRKILLFVYLPPGSRLRAVTLAPR